jgi:predicted transcriptional regulator of viral defense system
MANRPSIDRAIQLLDRPVFRTREIAALRGTSVGAASQALASRAREGVLVRAARGVWCIPSDPRFNQFLLVNYLSGGHRAYVSLVSALHLHGIIEQIPSVVYAVTTAHSHIQKTPLGTYSFHQVEPGFFAGFDWYRNGRGFLIASPEKALVDGLYISTRKGRRFGSFPELALGGFSIRRAREWVARISDPRIRRIVSEKLEALWRQSRRVAMLHGPG